MTFFMSIKKFDWFLVGAVLVLCVVGLLTLYSINYAKPQITFFNKQVIFIIFGLLVMSFFRFIDFSVLKNYRPLLLLVYLGGIAILAATLIFGKITRGAASWLSFGGLNFEPVELIKLIVILVLAKYFSLRHAEMYRARHVIVSGFYVFLPALLVLLQPDLGSAIILGAIWLGVVMLAGIKPRHLVLVAMALILIFIIAWFFGLKSYQKDRILTFINPQRDPFGSSYNLIQSKIAIGAGGLSGRGMGQGIQGRLDFLPEKHSDFIFAAYAEESGLAGVLFLLAIYGLLFFRLIKITLQGTNNFSRLICAGVCVMIFAQVFINIGATLGMLPITGITLPFVSYGGSNLLINFMALGIVQSIAARNRS